MLPSFFRGLMSFLIFIVTTAFGLSCFAGSECDYNPGTVLEFHTEGEFIYDQFGRVVLFRGANTPGNYDYPFPYGPKDIDILKKFGFNFIRIGISWKETNRNIVYAPHPYFPHAYLPGKGLTILWKETPKDVRAKYKRYKKDAERMSAPLLIGEYGAPRPSQFTFVTDWIKENLHMQDQLFIGSAVWVYHPSDGDWGIINHNREIKPYYFNILRRPYPRYTAGKPIELLYSPESKSFRYKYYGAAMGAPTEIYYPQDLFDSSQVNISASCDLKWSYDRAEEVIYIQSGCEGEIEVKIKDKEGQLDNLREAM
ncbi:MAG: hypothetical protein COS84_01550 [Armatimonadetes bacterium CG07_land_8_20_14_0_80_40_9]|nr:MAG: hypothetical protein COS84_01550 [Armatimonadetes bacterium CG07_land_8_20_14_0_80_40_9]